MIAYNSAQFLFPFSYCCHVQQSILGQNRILYYVSTLKKDTYSSKGWISKRGDETTMVKP